jgi:hypothetical protein
MNYSITQYLLLGAVALVYVGVITGPMRKIALRFNAVDAPDLRERFKSNLFRIWVALLSQSVLSSLPMSHSLQEISTLNPLG